MSAAFALSALVLAQSSPAAPPAPPPKPVTTAAADDPVTCRRVVTTGTRFSKSVCARRSEWAGVSAEGRANTEKMQSHRDFSLPPG